MIDYHKLVTQMDDSARQTLLELDEEAVTPLIDQFYAGVNEQTGLAILDVLCEIGGFEVLALLETLYHIDWRYESWRSVAETELKKAGRL